METAQNIRLTTMGGPEAAAAIDGVSNAMRGVQEAHNGLEERFSHKFSHIGLMLFAGEALRATGLGQETRQIIGVLNMSIMALGSTLGAAAGPLMLVGTGFAALVGILSHVHEHAKSQAEEIEKITEAHKKEYEGTQKIIESIDGYIAETGRVPGYLQRWRESEEILGQAQIKRLEVTERAELAASIRMMNESRERSESLREQISDQQILVSSLEKQHVSQEVLIAQGAQLKVIRDEYDKQSFATIQNKAHVDQLIASLKMLGTYGTDDLGKLTKAHKDAADAAKKHAKEEEDANKKILKDLNDQAMASYETFEKEQKAAKQMYAQFETSAKEAFNKINTEQSQAFAKAIVEGKSFAKETAHLWRGLAEQVIAQIEAMIAKLLILYALEQATGMGGAAAMGSPAGRILGFAAAGGADMMVDKPTLFLTGEGGQPEHVQVTPLSQMGRGSGGGGSGGVTLYMQNTFHGITDPNAIADTIGRKIVERINSRGDVGFSRT